MKETIYGLNDAYEWIDNMSSNPDRVKHMLDAIDHAITMIEKAEKINQKFTQIFEHETTN